MERDRDPVGALTASGIGLTDLVKRATRTAAELDAASTGTGWPASNDWSGGYNRERSASSGWPDGEPLSTGSATAGRSTDGSRRPARLPHAVDQRAQRSIEPDRPDRATSVPPPHWPRRAMSGEDVMSRSEPARNIPGVGGGQEAVIVDRCRVRPGTDLEGHVPADAGVARDGLLPISGIAASSWTRIWNCRPRC